MKTKLTRSDIQTIKQWQLNHLSNEQLILLTLSTLLEVMSEGKRSYLIALSEVLAGRAKDA